MSQITEALWREYMGDKPMPENCTYQQFYAAREVLWKHQDRLESLETIKQYEELLKQPDITEEQRDMIEDLITNERERW